MEIIVPDPRFREKEGIQMAYSEIERANVLAEALPYIQKYSGKTPVIHLKDFYSASPLDRETLELRPLGYGIQDIKSIMKAGIASGCDTFIYEQDNGVGRTMLEAAKLTREYLKSIGY